MLSLGFLAILTVTHSEMERKSTQYIMTKLYQVWLAFISKIPLIMEQHTVLVYPDFSTAILRYKEVS